MANDIFEFSEEQNKLISKLAKIMKYVALLFIFLGIIIGVFCGFAIIKSPIKGLSYLIHTIIAIIFGVWTNIVAYSFKQIVDTTGKDIEMLMNALKVLKGVYKLQLIWVLTLIICLLIILILNVIFNYAPIIVLDI